MEELQSLKSLAPVPLARVPSGPPVHAAPAAPATPAAAAPATPAAVVVASPLTSAAAVMSMAKVKAEKYVSKKDQRAVLDDTQQAGVRTLESWYLDTQESRPFMIKSFRELGYTVKNAVLAKLYLMSQGYSEADASAAGTAAMTDIKTVDVNQRYRDARKKENDLLQPFLLQNCEQDLPPTESTGSYSFATLESSLLLRGIRDTFLDAPDGRRVESVTAHMVAHALVRLDEIKVSSFFRSLLSIRI